MIEVLVLSVSWSFVDHFVIIQALKKGLIEYEASDTGAVPRWKSSCPDRLAEAIEATALTNGVFFFFFFRRHLVVFAFGIFWAQEFLKFPGKKKDTNHTPLVIGSKGAHRTRAKTQDISLKNVLGFCGV